MKAAIAAVVVDDPQAFANDALRHRSVEQFVAQRRTQRQQQKWIDDPTLAFRHDVPLWLVFQWWQLADRAAIHERFYSTRPEPATYVPNRRGERRQNPCPMFETRKQKTRRCSHQRARRRVARGARTL